MPPRPPQGEARRELLPLLARRQAGPSLASCLIYRPLRKAWLFSSGGWTAPEPLKCQACLVPISRPPPPHAALRESRWGRGSPVDVGEAHSGSTGHRWKPDTGSPSHAG